MLGSQSWPLSYVEGTSLLAPPSRRPPGDASPLQGPLNLEFVPGSHRCMLGHPAFSQGLARSVGLRTDSMTYLIA